MSAAERLNRGEGNTQTPQAKTGEFTVKKTSGMKELEVHHEVPIDSLLAALRYELGFNNVEIAKSLSSDKRNINRDTIGSYFERCGFPTASEVPLKREYSPEGLASMQAAAAHARSFITPERNRGNFSPEGLASKQATAARARLALAKQKDKQMKAVLGEDPRDRLSVLQTSHGSDPAIAAHIGRGVTPDIVTRWRKKLGLPSVRGAGGVDSETGDLVRSTRGEYLPAGFTEQELLVLSRRYPDQGFPDPSKKIGSELGLSRSQVLNIEQRALAKLKAALGLGPLPKPVGKNLKKKK